MSKDPQKTDPAAEQQKNEQAASQGQQKTDPPVEQQKSEPPVEPPAQQQAPAKTRIIISSNAGPAGSDDVFVSVNGRDFLIKRDVEVEVPEEVLSVLKNAVITDYVTDADGRIVRERRVPRFPFQVV